MITKYRDSRLCSSDAPTGAFGAEESPGRPATAHSGHYKLQFSLEQKLQCKLKDPGASGRSDLAESGITNIAVGREEIHVIEGVEEFRTELKRGFL